MKKKMNTKKGFTLVEIIVVLVIIAIMAAFAIPAYTGYVDKAKQSEVLAEGRAILIAAQTIGQEAYGKGTTPVIGDIKTLAGTTSFVEVEMSASGVVSKVTVTKGTHTAVYSGSPATWKTTGNTAIAADKLTIV